VSSYDQMRDFSVRYSPKGFRVLCFPCNEFMGQEPWKEAEIKRWVTKKWPKLNPVLFSKVNVNGDAEHEGFTFLKKCFPGDINWNFASKFVIGRDGIPAQRFDKKQSWQEIEKCIVAELAKDHADDKADENVDDEKAQVEEMVGAIQELRSTRIANDQTTDANTVQPDEPAPKSVEADAKASHFRWATSLKRGSDLRVYSENMNSWLDGTVVDIICDDEGEWLQVSYDNGKRAKQVQRFSDKLDARNGSNFEQEQCDADEEIKSEAEWKQLMGERLFRKIQAVEPRSYEARKVTGMLLELDNAELLLLLSDQRALMNKISEALRVLSDHQQKLQKADAKPEVASEQPQSAESAEAEE